MILASTERLGESAPEDLAGPSNHDAERGIVVIGGGLAGVATAHALATAGERVLLLDMGDTFASGASHSNAGIMTSSMADPWNGPGAFRQVAASFFRRQSALKVSPLRALMSARWGLAFLRNSSRSQHAYATLQNYILADYSVHETERLAKCLNVAYDQASVGSLKVFHEQSALRHGLELASVLSGQGLEHRALSERELFEFEPSLARSKTPIAGGIHFPGDRVGDARVFSQALGADLARLGSVAHLSTRATSIAVEKGKVLGVRTDRGFIAAKVVIVAAGTFSLALVKPLGVRLPIHPIKGYSITFDGMGPILPTYPIIDDAHHIAVTAFGNRLRVSGMAEISGPSTSLHQGRLDELLHAFRNLFPDIAMQLNVSNAEKWAGLRPVTPDGLPCIGETGVAGLFVNTGHAHLGWTMAAGSAQMISDLVSARQPQIDPQPFDPKRFS